MSTKHRGLAPSREAVAAQRREGYLTPAAAATKYKVTGKLIYKWRAEWLPKVGEAKAWIDGRPCAKRVGANVWVLEAAVRFNLRATGRLPLRRPSK